MRARFDLTGQRFGYLTAVAYAESSKLGAVWWVRCDCGKELKVAGGRLRAGRKTHCGCQTWTPERRAEAAERLRALAVTQEWSDERREALRAAWTDERRQAAAELARERWTALPPEERERLAALQKANWTPERRQAAAERLRARQIKALGARPAEPKASRRAPWTPERKEVARQKAIESWTPERRQAASDRARQRWLASNPTGRIDAVEPGERFGQLVVMGPYVTAADAPRRQRMWICRCNCGRLCVRRAAGLAYGQVKSCGCAVVAGARAALERLSARRQAAEDALAKLDAEQADLEHRLETA
jgi:hypothetical protein